MRRSTRTTFWASSGSSLALALAAGICLHQQPAAAQQARDQQARDVAPVTDHGLEFYVSEDAFQALYMRPMDLGDFGETQVNLGFFLNEERDLIASMDALLELRRPAESPWTVQVGPRAYAGLMNVEDTDLFALALGGRVQYALGGNGTAISLSGFYAPSIMTFGEADNVYDAHVRVETTLRDAVRVFVGYRIFQWNMTTGPVDDPLSAQNRKVDDGFQLGVRAGF